MFGKTRAAVAKEFLAEMERLRIQASNLKDRDYRYMLLRKIDEEIESFCQASFKNVKEMLERRTSTILFIRSWVIGLHSEQFLNEEPDWEDWSQSAPAHLH